ncbi:Argonaute complex, subunit Arb1 [Ophiocordyceps camponoti-floridani]|uniref:Argonaute complex, subunit Arb1 n=1 Tax=Ophiocordyceps camponoti-floridani TaxID=2030778 RepID=A0A8H4Q2Z9_9HYPO|nr:Argonaute complex, subunit Arb1 [Ophiocordyceps camponoti-floridani]
MPSQLLASDDEAGQPTVKPQPNTTTAKANQSMRLPKNRGTGFEEYFADPPMTPDEAAEEKTHIYASDIPFETRIQSCIQRFRARRRLHNDKARYFNEYLFLGGIDTSPNAFGGHHHGDLRHLTPSERRDATATDTVHSDPNTSDRFYSAGDENWSVDFTGVLAGFLSTSLVSLTSGIRHDMEVAVDVVENFLRYVRQHDVCPEYEDDVDKALALCADVRHEWFSLEKVRASFPGSFHEAATQLFSPSGKTAWDCPSVSLLRHLDYEAVFFTVCALLGETEALTAGKGGNIVTRVFDCTLEVVSVQLPDADLSQRFRSLAIDHVQHHPTPVGKALFKPTTIEEGWLDAAVDLPDRGTVSWLYFEHSILSNLKPGMKMALTVAQLNTGVRFVKTWHNLVPTFYTFLPQVLMKHYKMPRRIERPAPSVQDPDAEEKQHVREAQEG